MVGGGMSPSAFAVVVVVRCTLVVGLLHEGTGLLFGQFGMTFADAADTVGFVCGDEDVDNASLFAQDVVGTTANEDA